MDETKTKNASPTIQVLVWVRVNANGGYEAVGHGKGGEMDFDHMGHGEAEGKFAECWGMKLIGDDSENPEHLVCVVADVPLPPPTPFVNGQMKLFD